MPSADCNPVLCLSMFPPPPHVPASCPSLRSQPPVPTSSPSLLSQPPVPASCPRCWLNLSSPASAATLVPLPLLLLLSLYLLLTAIVAADDSGRRPISAEVYSRAK